MQISLGAICAEGESKDGRDDVGHYLVPIRPHFTSEPETFRQPGAQTAERRAASPGGLRQHPNFLGEDKAEEATMENAGRLRERLCKVVLSRFFYFFLPPVS